MKKLFNILLPLFVALGFLVGCGDSDSKKVLTGIEAIKERGVLRVAVFSDKPPFGFIDKMGKNQGYDVYFAKRLAKELFGDENKIEFVLVEAAGRVEILASGRVDIVLANFTVTKERAEKVDFTKPYFKTALGLVSSSSALITDISQLKDNKLIVNKGTTAEIYFTQNHPEITLLKYDQNTEAFQALRDGRGAALAHDNALLFAWARQNDGFETGIPSLGKSDAVAAAVQKGNIEVMNWVNEVLVSLEKEQFFHKNFEETLKPFYGDSINPDDLVVEGGFL